ncbi:Pentatricopeptide repeat-containing protein At2g31400 [Durusdinium trenchii]|uniref:Chloroplastic n=1 Tax=Durusdinium trenchii TaxID=1381693 RepID=A0ABP0MS45_9DINO
MEPVIELVYEGLYMLRIELSFLVALAFLWVAGQSLSNKRVDPVKARKAPAPRRGTTRRANVDETLTPSTVDPKKLQDPSWVVAQVAALCRSQVQRAMELYRVAVRAGLNIKEMSANDCQQLYSHLVTAAIRVGQADDALNLMKDLRRFQEVDVALLASATKLCTSKQLFADCLSIYDFTSQDPKLEVQDKSVWSCLLFCAVETKSYHRCSFFFERLRTYGSPSPKDFGNMVRYASSTSNWRLALHLIDDMQKAQVEVDSVVYNTVLAACVSAEQLDQARKLLDQMVAAGGVTDVITYNTLAKGYAKAGRMDMCFELYQLMRSRGLSPSQVTYGILLDGFINDNEVDKAVDIFNTMRTEGCQMNTVLYTTLIKGFARAGQVDQAVQIYEEMRKERSMQPDVITFSILIKANCDVGRLEEALKMLLAMKEAGLKPDEVVFNNLLGGCINDCKLELAKDLYKEMIASNVKPSVATFSILIRLYAQCKHWDEAVDLLRQELPLQKVSPEPRLFGQLAQCCLRDRQGRRASEVYKMLTESSTPTAAMNSTLLGMCAKLNMLDTGAEIMHLAADANSRVDPRDAAMMLEAALRKKKPQVMGVLKEAMIKLNLPVQA